ncbi:MAG TPA: FG-GAP-like repeat-containing protein [Ignavibacteriales bacterium]|nr:FG-GAP-like repeat-containing protein [Ignavibacteriales bacterium]
MKLHNISYMMGMLFLFPVIIFPQNFTFTRIMNDSSGNSIFTGGYRERTLMSYVDIDGDGDDDIFFIGSSNGPELCINYFENIGSKSDPKYKFITDRYSPYDYFDSRFNRYRPIIQFADIDGDNDYDLLMGYGTTLRLYRNSGTSSQASFNWDNYETVLTAGDCNEYRCYCGYPSFVDIDHDGDLDLFYVVNSSRNPYPYPTIRFYRNIGDKNNFNFKLESENLIQGISPNGNLCFYDTDNDSDYDLLFYGSNSTDSEMKLYLYENTGDSTAFNFKLKSDSLLNVNYFSSTSFEFISVCDDKKGARFCFSTTEGPAFSFRYVSKDNSFKPDQESICFLDLDIGSKSFPQFVDIDNDGDYDLFIAGKGNSILNKNLWPKSFWYFENTGDKYHPKFISRTFQSDTIKNILQFKFADIDSDGDYDLFTGSTDNEIKFYLNTGTKESASFMLIDTASIRPAASYAGYPSPLLFDMDGDSDLDLMISFRAFVYPGPPVLIYKNTGDKYHPVWTSDSQNYFNIQNGPAFGVYDAWDYDKDGDSDLTVLGKIYENTGSKYSASFTENGLIKNLKSDNGLDAMTLIDIDSDGDKDLFIGNNDGGILFYRNDTPTSVEKERPNSSMDFLLFPNYPNPFNPGTKIKYHVGSAKTAGALQQVSLKIFDLLGRDVAQVLNEEKPSGNYEVEFLPGSYNLPSGTYYYQLKAGSYTATKKMMYIK